MHVDEQLLVGKSKGRVAYRDFKLLLSRKHMVLGANERHCAYKHGIQKSQKPLISTNRVFFKPSFICGMLAIRQRIWIAGNLFSRPRDNVSSGKN